VDLVRSWPHPSDHPAAERAVHDLARDARKPLGHEAIVESSFDCRYAGQSHELTVPSIAEFHAEHRRRNGFSRPNAPVEVVALRVKAQLQSPVALTDLPPPRDRSGQRRGPSVIAEADCTIWVADGWTAQVGGGGAWVLNR
jgi:N-methylhydantoinase A/oxoprolinase/acetone carboxylase beta subunit